jgi:hypothetical protein
MNIKNIFSMLLTIFSFYGTDGHENCLYNHNRDKKEIEVYVHGKPVHIHIDGQPVQPTVNVVINMTVFEKC